VQGRSESRWCVIAHRHGGREARLARGGISEHDAFLGHEMRGPAGTGRCGVSMAGGGVFDISAPIFLNRFTFADSRKSDH